ncbi:alpha/beta hydrolase [Nocardioides bruguierae]|uniref:alpha/beta hydrolase n=1 Tax=Nocardioides bruguierae TaxID=2945102 RepID=UPI0020221A72|nr:alpha/beta hydrolase [Nocardioides bruguierae]MCL8026097.1 alpha/beta hydrolase [Nocardioides bruguierae]
MSAVDHRGPFDGFGGAPGEQSLAVLAERAKTPGRPMREATPAESRAAQYTWLPYMGTPAEGVTTTDRFIPGPHGDIPVRVHVPTGEGPFPALVAFHGGCWIVGNVEVIDLPHKSLAAATGCVVVAVNYAKAPEHRFPAPLQDCVAGYAWTHEHAAELNLDSSRIGVVGDSAGGNLSATVSLVTRDGGLPGFDEPLPAPAVQVLVYPATDWRLDTASAEEFADGFGLSTADMSWSWYQYVASEDDLKNPFVAPAEAASLAGLPPAIMVTAGADVLRDEGVFYAQRLAADGVPVEHLHYPEALHGFWWMAGAVDDCARMEADIASALEKLWGSPMA